MKGRGLKLKFRSYDLELIHFFAVSSHSRNISPVVLVEIEYEGIIGYGEASVPPYLYESRESVLEFLHKSDLTKFRDPLQLNEILEYVDQIAPGNHAAKASLDIALHDLAGKLAGLPLSRMWGLDPDKTPYSSITLGIDTPEMVEQKAIEASESKILKIKLGGASDMDLIRAVRKVTDKPLFVDINQGWTDKHEALDMIYWLRDKGVVMVEQPMSAESVDDMAWLTQHSPLPTFADEAVQGIEDVRKMAGIYNGINIKLMKCGGLHAAHQMMDIARELGLEVMIGCMVETSCAVSAAAQISPLVKWCDLDGNLLIKNDVFEGVKINEGKIILPERPGIGVVPLNY